MSKIKEIIVFSIGDSLELKTWSNVPYFFTKSLEDNQIKINRVNIDENYVLSIIYKYSIFAFLKLFYKNSNHTYFRSGLNYYLTNLKIRNAIKKYNKSDAHLFLTYSFCSKNYSSKKTVLFSDWSYLYYLNTFLNRKPFWFEKKTLKREEKHIELSDAVISLFPKSNKFNASNYKNLNLYYLGNVINSNYKLNKIDLITKKLVSNKLLFIGNKKYLKGALDLINAFKELSNKNIELHIVGLKEEDVNVILPNLFYYGYLNKGIIDENELYYKLISEAKAIINTNPDWGAFSAMTEAMYFYTPIITSPYSEFTETYGNDISFGYYINNDSKLELLSNIDFILNISNEKYLNIMNNAHDIVEDFNWGKYSNKVLEILSR